MATLNSEQIFKDQKKPKISEPISMSSNAVDIIVQVEGTGTFSLNLKGVVNPESENYILLNSVNMNDFSTSNNISKNGIYSFSGTGFSKIKCELVNISGGSIDVYAKVTG